MKNSFSIAAQILLVVSVTVVTVLGVASIIEVNILRNRETALLEQRGSLTADRLANSIAYPLSNRNQAESERVVLHEIVSRDVARIQVFDEAGNLHLSKSRMTDGSIANQVVDDNPNQPKPVYSFTRDVNFNNKTIGRITLDITDTALEAEIVKLRWGVAVKLLVLVVLLSLVLYAALRVMAVRPLFKLKRWVEALSDDHIHPPKFNTCREMNALADAFSGMSVRLQNKNVELEYERARLEQLNRQLQVEVEERKRAEKDLVENEERYRTLVEASSLMVWTADAEGNSTPSPGWFELSGQPAEESIGEGWLTVLHPDDREKATNAWVRAQQEQTSFESEFRVQARDGSYRHVMTRAAPILQDGLVREWIGAIY